MDPLPFETYLDYISGKIVHPDWDYDQWMRQAPDVRARAFFLANVENARFLDRSKGMLDDFMRKAVDTIDMPDGSQTTALKVGSRADFVRQMREFMIKEGMLTNDELDLIKEKLDGDVKELASRT